MKKRAFFALLLVFTLLFTLLCSEALATHTEYVRNPSGRSVNVRRGPGKGWAVDFELKPGTAVTVEEFSNGWARISSPGSGWMMSKFLTDNPPADGSTGGKIASTMVRYIYSKNGKKVNVRTGPSVKGYAVAAQLEPGTKVNLLSAKKGWSTIEYNGFTLFVQSQYLSSADPATIAAPAEETPASSASGSSSSASSSFTAFSAHVVSPNGKKVNMRIRADVSADRIAQLPPDTNIQVIGEVGGWYKIHWANATGYMMKQYVQK